MSTSEILVKLSLSLPFTKDEFTEDKQSKFRESLAVTADVKPADVKIDEIEIIGGRRGAGRHLLARSIRVDSSIRAADNSRANSMANALTLDKINAELAKVGLPRSIMLEAPRVTDTFMQSGSNLLVVASADSPHVLVLVVKMPYTKAKFDGAKQGLFKDAIASAAGTSPLNVDILSIAEARRRAGSIEVETKISAMDAANLHALSSALGTGDSILAKINAELTKRGLPASTIVSVKSKKSGLSDGAIAGMVIGSVACAAIFVGVGVQLTKKSNKTVETFKSIDNLHGSLEVDGCEVDGWMEGRRLEHPLTVEHPLMRKPIWDEVLFNTSLQLKDIAEEEMIGRWDCYHPATQLPPIHSSMGIWMEHPLTREPTRDYMLFNTSLELSSRFIFGAELLTYCCNLLYILLYIQCLHTAHTQVH